MSEFIDRPSEAKKAIAALRRASRHAHAAAAADFGVPEKLTAACVMINLSAELIGEAFAKPLGRRRP